ncbi:hypothetical protein NL676_021390 [Syzygium grande]|nr:hypothetical protein NL676_021390 [Syzygium grande]
MSPCRLRRRATFSPPCFSLPRHLPCLGLQLHRRRVPPFWPPPPLRLRHPASPVQPTIPHRLADHPIPPPFRPAHRLSSAPLIPFNPPVPVAAVDRRSTPELLPSR